MDELFSISDTDLTSFLGKRIPFALQHRALLEASTKKAGGIEEWLVVAPDSGRRVVEGLARLTAELQELRARDNPLDAEPGLFELVGDGAVASQAFEFIRDAAEAGYLKLIDEPPNEKVRIHLSLAAHFEASYRGGYRSNRLTAEDVAAFAGAADDRAIVCSQRVLLDAWPANGSHNVPNKRRFLLTNRMGKHERRVGPF